MGNYEMDLQTCLVRGGSGARGAARMVFKSSRRVSQRNEPRDNGLEDELRIELFELRGEASDGGLNESLE